MSNSPKRTLKLQIDDVLKSIDLSKITTKKVIQEVKKKLDLNTIQKEKEIEKLVIEHMKKEANKKCGKSDDCQKKEKPKKQATSNRMKEDSMNGYDSVLKKETLPKKNLPAKHGHKMNEKEEIKPKFAKKTSKLSPDISDSSESSDDDSYSYHPEKVPLEDQKSCTSNEIDVLLRAHCKDDESISGDSEKASSSIKFIPVKKINYKRSKRHYKKKELSPELAFLMGSKFATHLQIYRKLWATIKEHDLFDPSNRRFAICNSELLKIIGEKRFMIFRVMKYIKKHYV